MPKYAYRAKDERGQPSTGFVEAASREEAIARLRSERKIALDIIEGGAPLDVEQALTRRAARTVKRDEVIAFSAQMAVMLETGVPVSEAIGSYLVNARTGSLRRVMAAVHDRVQAGGAFSVALGGFPKAFPPLMVSLIKASEASGTMGLMFRRVSEYLGKERRTLKQIKGAVTYPLVMVTMALTVTIFLVVWVLPKFARIYSSKGAALPTPTRIVMGISDFLINDWMWLVAGIIASVFGFLWGRTTPRGRRWLDWAKLKAPIIGPMYRQFYLTRATRTLGTLLASGVSLVEAIRIVRGITTNSEWEALWDRMLRSITSGHTIAEVVTRTWLIPAPIASMLAAAERTGKLADALDRIAETTEKDLDEAIKAGTQLIEPLMITIMGGLIGGIAIALLLPIFSIGNVMAH